MGSIQSINPKLLKKLNKSIKPFSHFVIFQKKKNSEIIVGHHDLTFQAQKKASSYDSIVKLWQAVLYILKNQHFWTWAKVLKDIIIDRDDSGIPLVKLPEQFSKKGIINVSISHTDDYATATAIFQLI